ncbi:hypothetical protein BTH42_06450 [Burkholderia sp. SRS-W-2-2016]|uniref:Arm DNA-binding domain-containing protein n=1 Tax=Burkholderia sp. SRS-W-2-2016 TaxID=1926878 RepID=UPI00094B2F55|nr:hypothetical protein BTH42_06450 [Burkholderia sp. SRS-W-2-2016]
MAGLHLQVRPTGSASWVLKYQLHNRSRELGLGRRPDVGLTDARDRAAEARIALVQALGGVCALGQATRVGLF